MAGWGCHDHPGLDQPAPQHDRDLHHRLRRCHPHVPQDRRRLRHLARWLRPKFSHFALTQTGV